MIIGSKSVFSRPDRRYWRRRANRRVRNVRFTKKLLRWSGIVVINGIVAGLLLFAAARIIGHVTRTERFSVRQIEVTGARRASIEAIRGRLGHYVGRNILEMKLGEVASLAAQDRWVRHASAKRILPATLRVTIRERIPCAVALIDGIAHVVDTTGYVIGPSGADMLEDLPVLTGLDDLEDSALVAELSRGVRTIRTLRAGAGTWVDGVSELDLGRRDRVAVRTVDPGPRILLDPHRVDRNVARYIEMRNEIGRRLGRVDYVDLRWNDRISVMPAMQVP